MMKVQINNQLVVDGEVTAEDFPADMVDDFRVFMDEVVQGKVVQFDDSPVSDLAGRLLEVEGVYEDGVHGDYDFGGSVYWSSDRRCAVVIWQ